MKYFFLSVFAMSLLASCSNENTRKLNDLVSYMDSLEQVVDEFHRSGDTTYYTSVIDPAEDPEEPSNRKQDTVIVPHASKNYFTGREFAGIVIEDDLLEMVTAEYQAKRNAIDTGKLSEKEGKALEKADAAFKRITTEFID